MLRIYGFFGAASLAPHLLLEELGLPYEFIAVDREQGEHKAAAYLALNPHGRVPTLVHVQPHAQGAQDDVVLFESAAICLYLADLQPQSGFAPALGSAARGQLYKWMMFLTNTLQPALMAYFYPERNSTDSAHSAAIKAQAELNAMQIYRQIDADLAAKGPYLLGESLSVADFYLLMLVRWGRWFAQPAVANCPHIAALVETLSARPAVQRTFAKEQIPAPYCLLAQ